ncbi:phasin family protein [Kiloniella antarctica]|uniref:Phasin family protein n=1 Tax=Kiloniella antarctica TaxID=1550907 RepID=A0ABW5BJC8_9PROT
MTTSTKKKPTDTGAKPKAEQAPKAEQTVEPKASVIENEVMENIMKSTMDAATKGYEQAFSFSQAQTEKVMETLYKQCESAADLGKENAELAAKSGNSFAEGYQKLNNMFMGMAQETMKKNMAVVEAFVGAKDFNEVSDIQTKFARESFDTMVKSSTEISELATKLTNEAVEPVRKQVTEAVEKMTKAAA